MTTKFATAKYTEIIDLQTNNDSVSVLGIHTPIGSKPRRMLAGFFQQFRKFKYNGCSIRIVPAANLPVDPLGLSGIPGTTDVMDPRDALNPIMFHGCCGDNLNYILNQIYKEGRYDSFSGTTDSIDLQEDPFTMSAFGNQGVEAGTEFYYKALSDPTWKKFGIQSGVRLKGLHPMVHKVALTKQLVPSSQLTLNLPGSSGQDFGKFTSVINSALTNAPNAADSASGPFDSIGIVPGHLDYSGESPSVPMEWNINQMFTNGVTALGWLPTTTWFTRTASSNSLDTTSTQIGPAGVSSVNDTGNIYLNTYLPKAFMGILLMPPSYKVEQYFRCAIDHYFSFKDFTTSLDPMPINYNFAYKDLIDHGDTKTFTGKELLEGYPDDDTLEIINGVVDTVTTGVS